MMIQREFSQPKSRFDTTLDNLRREYIRAVLAQAGGHITHAAKLLGMARTRLYRYMAKLNIDPLESRSVSSAGPRIEADLPTDLQGTLDERVATVEHEMIVAALRSSNGSKTNAARELGIARSRLCRRMEALGITA